MSIGKTKEVFIRHMLNGELDKAKEAFISFMASPKTGDIQHGRDPQIFNGRDWVPYNGILTPEEQAQLLKEFEEMSKEDKSWVPSKGVSDSKKDANCSCSSRDLFNFGCKCGAVIPYKEKRIW